MTNDFKRNLLIVHTPGSQDLADWIAVKEKIDVRAPEIEVRIVNNRAPDPSINRWLPSRPSLVFSPCHLLRYRPIGGKIYAGRPMDKMEEHTRLVDGGIPTPRTRLLVPGMALDEADWGEFVVVKPAQPEGGSYGRGVVLARASSVGERFGELTGDGRVRMIVQNLIDTTDEAGRLTTIRVLIMFGRPLYANRHTQVDPRPTLEEIVDRGGNDIAHNARGRNRQTQLVADADVLDLASRTGNALRELPVLGLDIIRDRSTGKLYVVETNSGGNVWHLSSDMVAGKQSHKRRRLKYNQFGALDIAADALIEKTREEASLFSRRMAAGPNLLRRPIARR